jgi:hypothetical protein
MNGKDMGLVQILALQEPSYVLSLLLPLEWKMGRGRGFHDLMQLANHLSRFENGFDRVLGNCSCLRVNKATLKPAHHLGVHRPRVRPSRRAKALLKPEGEPDVCLWIGASH